MAFGPSDHVGVAEIAVLRVRAIDRETDGEGAGGEVRFVHLTCEVEELERRVVADDRRDYHKLGNVPGLRAALQRWELYTPIPGVDTLAIDNTRLSPEQVVERIVEYLGWVG